MLKHAEEGLGLSLEAVKVVHDIGKNILSIVLFLSNGGKIKGNESKLVMTYKGNVIVFYRCKLEGLYYTRL